MYFGSFLQTTSHPLNHIVLCQTLYTHPYLPLHSHCGNKEDFQLRHIHPHLWFRNVDVMHMQSYEALLPF